MTKQSQHTPGPWQLRQNPDKDRLHSHWIDGPPRPEISAPGGIPIAEVRDLADKQGHANARLIALAPEMLEALEAFCDLAEPRELFPQLCASARAIIARAEGGAL